MGSRGAALERVRRATERCTRSRRELDAALEAARSQGFSFRELGQASGINYETLRRRFAGDGRKGTS